jgi:predicted metal-dependent HD superfamily phosphohydrolase
MDADLRSWWANDVGNRAGATAALEAVIVRYREPHRRYHTVNHVAAVRQLVGELLREVVVGNPNAVRLASWYHDAVYDARSSTNEAESAELAATELTKLGIEPATIDAVRRLVMATAVHEPSSADEAVLIDADLAIFAAQPTTYQSYVAGIRFEYLFVTDEDWKKGRARVLERFLERDAIFHTDAMKPHEPQARANLGAELAGLRELLRQVGP